MSDVEHLRRQAERALRLARAISDARASEALRLRAAELLAKADELDAQAQPHNESRKT
jgi:hypothetical protein